MVGRPLSLLKEKGNCVRLPRFILFDDMSGGSDASYQYNIGHAEGGCDIIM